LQQTRLAKTSLSVLDLAFLRQGGTAAETFRNTLDLAQHAEEWGYKRFWLAEHHNIPGIVCSATSVLIGYVASGTSKIRVGSGGVMLPNHAPIVIAEQFGTLETLYPGRIDLGLGRAPGGDPAATRALRRTLRDPNEEFPDLLSEVRDFLRSPRPGQTVHAFPGADSNIPIWLLGSSGYSAHLAGELGLPFAFASHFQPDNLLAALQIYRENFHPSEILKEPYAMAGIPIIAADTDEKAQFLATTQQQAFLSLIRYHPRSLMPPVERIEWTPEEEEMVNSKLRASIVGRPETVREKLEDFLKRTQVQELILSTNVYNHRDRLRSYKIIAELAGKVQIPEELSAQHRR
jgi:luciferase family oxidoreductase group 1